MDQSVNMDDKETFANQNMLNPNSFTSISEPEKICECSYDCVQKPSTWISNELLISFADYPNNMC